MIGKELSKALGEQLMFELYSSYLYLGMAAKLERMKMPGAAHWMKVQSREELNHADRIYTYLNDHDAEIEMEAIKKPEIKAKTPKEIFETALNHEKCVTARIDRLAALAVKNNHFATMSFLNYFLTEQVQEEKSVQNIVDRFSLAGKSQEAALFLDSELTGRSQTEE